MLHEMAEKEGMINEEEASMVQCLGNELMELFNKLMNSKRTMMMTNQEEEEEEEEEDNLTINHDERYIRHWQVSELSSETDNWSPVLLMIALFPLPTSQHHHYFLTAT